MHLVGIEVQLYIYEVNSLKEKRSIIRSILDKIHHLYFAAGAEVGDNDQLDSATLGFAAVSNDGVQAERILRKVIDLIDQRFDCEIMKIDWLRY